MSESDRAELARMAENDRWVPGGKVTILVDGTPVEGEVQAAPLPEHDDAWASDDGALRHDAWIVRVEDFGCSYAVVDRRAIELAPAQVTRALLFRATR